MSQEALRVDFDRTIVYFENAVNAVGATTSLTLRTGLPPIGAGDAYVKKYGTPYPATDVTDCGMNIPRGAGANIGRFRIYAADGTLLGTLTDNGANVYADGAAVVSNTDIYIVLDCTLGAYTVNNGDVLSLGTDIDPGVAPTPFGLQCILSGETVTLAGGETVTWYVSGSGSTYYDSGYKYGGGRHAPMFNSAKYPFFEIDGALTAGAPLVEILDSEIYTPTTASVSYAPGANDRIQAALGQTPTIAAGVGARPTRRPVSVYNNLNAIFVNPTGNDANPGTWQLPFQTLQAAYVAMIAGPITNLVIGGANCAAEPVFAAQLNMTQANTRLDADWEIVPRIDANQPIRANAAVGTVYVYGVFCRNLGTGTAVFAGVTSLEIKECTVFGGGVGIACQSGTNVIEFCNVYGSTTGINVSGAAVDCRVKYCDVHDCPNGILFAVALGNATSIEFCMVWNCSLGIQWVGNVDPLAIGMAHTTIWNCTNGLYLSGAIFYTCIPQECIIDSCTNGIFMLNAGGTITVTHFSLAGCTNPTAGAGAGGVTQLNAIAGDPLLSDPARGFFGVQGQSPCYHTGATAHNIGCYRAALVPGGNTITLDGLTFDGSYGWFEGTYTNVTRTALVLKWCTFLGFYGAGMDNFGTAATDGQVLNCLSYRCGNGFVFAHQDNIMNETACYKHGGACIYFGNTGNVVIHVSTLGGKYGLYVTSGAGLTQTDNIWSGASIASIYCPSFLALAYSCWEGYLSPGVDTSDPSNVGARPFFVGTEEDEEDLHLRTIEGGFSFDSPAKDGASDGYDMGAYLIDRGVTDRGWDTYELEHKSWSVNETLVGKGVVSFEDEEGSFKASAMSHRRRFSIRFAETSAMAERDRKMIEYFTTLVQTDENDLRSNEALVRIHFRPREYVYPGTATNPCAPPVHGAAAACQVDATDAWLYHAGGGYVTNEFKGYHATIRWTDEITNGVVDAAAATITSAGAGWIVDEWMGYWVRQGQYYFYILSNTATVLTVSDPFGNLVDVAANFAFYIQSSHKVVRNDANYLYLDDAEGLLRDGNFNFFVDFILCRIRRPEVAIQRQMGSRMDIRYDEIPDRLDVEEAGLCL